MNDIVIKIITHVIINLKSILLSYLHLINKNI